MPSRFHATAGRNRRDGSRLFASGCRGHPQDHRWQSISTRLPETLGFWLTYADGMKVLSSVAAILCAISAGAQSTFVNDCAPVPQLREFPRLTDSQLTVVVGANFEFAEWMIENQRRISDVSREIATEVARGLLDPIAVEGLYATTEIIPRNVPRSNHRSGERQHRPASWRTEGQVEGVGECSEAVADDRAGASSAASGLARIEGDGGDDNRRSVQSNGRHSLGITRFDDSWVFIPDRVPGGSDPSSVLWRVRVTNTTVICGALVAANNTGAPRGSTETAAETGVRPDFPHVADGFTSPDRSTGITAAFRIFSVPTFGKTCEEAGHPARLIAPKQPVLLHVGKWFDLSRLVIIGVDRKGDVVRPAPIHVEVEKRDPPLLNLRSDMISQGRLLPIRPGKFRFRARTICSGAPADVCIQAVVRPR
jgi:hypothetical protein